MAPSIDLKDLKELIQQRSSQERILVALAGPPGSGKSTLAGELESALNQEQPEQAMILPMDGFHYDDLHLVPAGLRPRKGAPQTFDVGGFYHILRRLRERQEDFVAVPVFDRDRNCQSWSAPHSRKDSCDFSRRQLPIATAGALVPTPHFI